MSDEAEKQRLVEELDRQIAIRRHSCRVAELQRESSQP